MHVSLFGQTPTDDVLGIGETRLVLFIPLDIFLVTIIHLFPPVAQFYI